MWERYRMKTWEWIAGILVMLIIAITIFWFIYTIT